MVSRGRVRDLERTDRHSDVEGEPDRAAVWHAVEQVLVTAYPVAAVLVLDVVARDSSDPGIGFHEQFGEFDAAVTHSVNGRRREQRQHARRRGLPPGQLN